jgi:hypothetical protein
VIAQVMTVFAEGVAIEDAFCRRPDRSAADMEISGDWSG